MNTPVRTKKISKLKNHFIVCGGGETGRPVIAELIKNGEQVVLIEMDEEIIERCQEIGDLLYIKGDAADDASLAAAGTTCNHCSLLTCIFSASAD